MQNSKGIKEKRKKKKKRKRQKILYLRNTTQEIEVRCIFDEEDERVLPCQTLVPLVPKIQRDTK